MNPRPRIVRRPSKKAKSGWRYMVLYRVPAEEGGTRRISAGTFALEREAEDCRDRLIREWRDGAAPEDSTLTVRALLHRWQQATSPNVQPTTASRYACDVERLEAALGDRLAASLRPADLDAYWAELRADGRRDGLPGGLSAKSVRVLRGTLGTAFAWAVRGGLLRANPVAASQAPRLEAKASAALALPTIARIIGASRGHRLEGAVILAAAGGMRRGEVLAVRWSDVDLERGVVSVSRTVIYVRGEGTVLRDRAKSAAGARLVTLPEQASAMLADLRRRRIAQATLAGRRWSASELVSARRDGGPINPDNAGTQFSALMTKAEMPGLHLHLLRHALATELLHRQKVDVVTVQRQLGHSDPATTMRMYVEPEFSQQLAAAERLSDAWKASAEAAENPSEQQNDNKSAAVLDLDAARARKSPA